MNVIILWMSQFLPGIIEVPSEKLFLSKGKVFHGKEFYLIVSSIELTIAAEMPRFEALFRDVTGT